METELEPKTMETVKQIKRISTKTKRKVFGLRKTTANNRISFIA
jgi:hypothetical protein